MCLLISGLCKLTEPSSKMWHDHLGLSLVEDGGLVPCRQCAFHCVLTLRSWSHLHGQVCSMIQTGLDWSENTQTGWMFFAMVHVDALDLELLTDRLTLAKTAIGKTGAFVFKHLEADTRTHEVFYEALLQVPSLSMSCRRIGVTGSPDILDPRAVTTL